MCRSACSRCCSPWATCREADIRYLKTDWTGLVLLVLAVGSLQMVLDQGQTRDWFNSRFIQIFTAITVFCQRRLLHARLEQSEEHRRSVAAQGSQLPRRPARHHRLWRDVVRHHRASAAAHPAPDGLSRHERRHAVHSARGSKRHRAVHHRQLPHAVDRFAHPGRRRHRAVSRRHHDDGGAVAASRRLGHRRAWHHRRHRHGAVLRAAHRGRFRQNGA